MSGEDVKPFKIDISESVLEDLKFRLERTRLPDTLQDDTSWQYGTDLGYMKELLEYWKSSYNWKEQEKKLNEIPQFKTKINGLDVHFVHVRSKHENAQPLIIVHGWPGSFLECKKVLPMLTDPTNHGGSEKDAFHVICPSIPGYGFSEAPHKSGFNAEEAAFVFIKLMNTLGYKQYLVQGGDWGSLVTYLMASSDSKNIIGLHSNMPQCRIPFQRGIFPLLKFLLTYIAPTYMLNEDEVPNFYRLLDYRRILQITGYMHLQATKPQTVGYALNDSPLGLAAYIIEKFQEWSDCNASIETKFTKDELLNNVMIYWVTNSITSSMRFYRENIGHLIESRYVDVPSALAIFQREILPPIRQFCEYAYNIQKWTKFEKGGHFAHLEEPQLLVQDLREFRQQLQDKNQVKKEL